MLSNNGRPRWPLGGRKQLSRIGSAKPSLSGVSSRLLPLLCSDSTKPSTSVAVGKKDKKKKTINKKLSSTLFFLKKNE